MSVTVAQTKYQTALEHRRRIQGALREAEQAVLEAADELQRELVQHEREHSENRS